MLKVCEIFKSIQGESTWAGYPCVFVRLAGCNLDCDYCDSPYAREEGEDIPIHDIVATVMAYECPLVEITGGEPLIQPAAPALADQLLIRGKTVLVETNGSLPIDLLPPGAIRIMDIKCPTSGMADRMDLTNLDRLNRQDEVKFVLSDRTDYEWAREFIRHHRLPTRCGAILFSAVFDRLDYAELSRWILDDRLNVRMQVQLHKLIWSPEARSV